MASSQSARGWAGSDSIVREPRGGVLVTMVLPEAVATRGAPFDVARPSPNAWLTTFGTRRGHFWRRTGQTRGGGSWGQAQRGEQWQGLGAWGREAGAGDAHDARRRNGGAGRCPVPLWDASRSCSLALSDARRAP